ncbi:hypothetical protein BDZ94DRAFT_1247706 [Collybia nuda]|uniref:Uncharacterized protein n=1 Tax=Collybia nuda TaxID=64659 RepID=A0A9P6CPA0_9AGAR|nr:hypothetical protein BDZ94DRAFT_1247706 [Collybia nuda]
MAPKMICPFFHLYMFPSMTTGIPSRSACLPKKAAMITLTSAISMASIHLLMDMAQWKSIQTLRSTNVPCQ